MVGRFWKTITCRAIAPLLIPFGENTLDEKRRARVMAHLDRCEDCRNEVAQLAAMGDFFRANPPTPAAPPVDLWARLEAQIQADQPQVVPSRPRRPAMASPAAQWRSFLFAFTQTGAVMAAVLVCGLFLLNKYGTNLSLEHANTAAPMAATSASDGITIRLQPRHYNLGVVAPKAKTQIAASTPVRKSRAASTLSFGLAQTRYERRVAQAVPRPVRKAKLDETISSVPASDTPAPRIVASAETDINSRMDDSSQAYKALTERDFSDRRVTMQTDGAAFFAYSENATALRRKRDRQEDLIRPASWMSEESEGVSADSAVEATTALHRQETLFSYGAR